MAESEREDFWGCILTDKKKSISWNGPSEANDDIAELDISHRLVVSQACLGTNAKEGVRNLVQATSLDASDNKITIVIASLRAVTAEVCPLQLTFSSPVSFELLEGSGPVHLSGNHIQAISSYEMSDSGSDESETEDVESIPMLVEKLSSKRGVTPTPKGPPSKKTKLEDEESSDSSDEEDSDLDEEAEKPKETTTEKKEETKKETKDEKPEEKVEEKEPKDSKEEKKPVTLADLVAADENDSDDEDFEESEGDSDASDSDKESDDEDMEDEDTDDEEDESDSEEEEEAAATSKKKPVQNGKINGSPKKTPSADNKKTPVSAKTTPAGNKTPAGKTTPAAKSAPTTPQAPTDIGTIKQMLLKTPNLPRKQDKFKNYMKSRFKTDDEKTITSMWDWVQKNKK